MKDRERPSKIITRISVTSALITLLAYSVNRVLDTPSKYLDYLKKCEGIVSISSFACLVGRDLRGRRYKRDLYN